MPEFQDPRIKLPKDLPIDPSLAADLSKRTSEHAVDLSKEAIKQRKRQQRLQQAADWARSMTNTFKGIAGAPRRRDYVRLAIEKFDLPPEETDV